MQEFGSYFIETRQSNSNCIPITVVNGSVVTTGPEGVINEIFPITALYIPFTLFSTLLTLCAEKCMASLYLCVDS